jgi:hypothetical protein
LPPRLVGIDFDPDRIQEARSELERLRLERRVGEGIEVEFWCGNALDLLPPIAHRVEVCFLYLVPRRIKPILLQPCKRGDVQWPMVQIALSRRPMDNGCHTGRFLYTLVYTVLSYQPFCKIQ